MNKKMTVAKQNIQLIAAYQEINDEGRDVLDTVIQKLAELNWKPEEMEQEKNTREKNGI